MKQSEIEKAIAKELTPEAAYLLALYAKANARRLVRVAGYAYDARQYGPCLSLSISALEEIGKYYSAIWFAASPGADALSFLKQMRKHHGKQTTGYLMALVLELTTRSKGKRRPKTEGRVSLISLMREMASDVEAPTEQEQRDIEEVVKALQAGDLERLRQTGLYVDLALHEGQLALKDPGALSARDVRPYLVACEFALDAMSRLNRRLGKRLDVGKLSEDSSLKDVVGWLRSHFAPLSHTK
jgi:AbiV family abortive infection protein